MSIGSLFSGIGGLELGLERAGLGPVVWQCEINPFCRAVLEKHWPNVTRFEDVTQPRSYPHVDIICGGFPCQDVSSAGKRRGIGGARSGLWFHFARIIGIVLPRFVVIENVASGAKKWLPSVGRDLAGLGYRARAFSLSAFDVGAPHLRRRLFVVGTYSGRQHVRKQRQSGVPLEAAPPEFARAGAHRAAADADRGGESQPQGSERQEWRWVADGSRWTVEPPVCGVANGVPRRLDRLRSLGNAVVPQCAEAIGRMIVEMHRPAQAVVQEKKR